MATFSRQAVLAAAFMLLFVGINATRINPVGSAADITEPMPTTAQGRHLHQLTGAAFAATGCVIQGGQTAVPCPAGTVDSCCDAANCYAYEGTDVTCPADQSFGCC